MNLHSYLFAQREWSLRVFGEGERTNGILHHIRKETAEIEAAPYDLSEWVDVIILALDGYWRHGGGPDTILPDLIAKQRKNFERQWPIPGGQDEATEHIRG